MPTECSVKLYNEAPAQARASGLARASPGLGLGLKNLKPRPAQARPKPGYPGQAGPGTSLIATWMGISNSQFATCRTEVTAARAVHLLLRQLVLQQNIVTPLMEPRHLTLLDTLNSLMSSRILSPVDPNGGYASVANLQAGDANAVRMKISALKTQVADVRARWGAQYQ
ncbi:hypothetical protein B0H19DRAFT_1263768 [Mycena capillaripes]|nr:hypothetical protein B0H19DRAFT_1263768 [Mycena capillaripes]